MCWDVYYITYKLKRFHFEDLQKLTNTNVDYKSRMLKICIIIFITKELDYFRTNERA